LRSSDRRKTADSIIKDLDLEKKPAEDGASDEDKAAATAERASLRNSLLPDNAMSARFTTTHGPELKQVSGTVFVGNHHGEEQRILWVKIDERMYPTGMWEYAIAIEHIILIISKYILFGTTLAFSLFSTPIRPS
jgi:translation initiation factor 2D